MHAQKSQGDRNIGRAHLAFDQVQRLQRIAFRPINLSPCRGAQPHLKLACLHPGEDLGPQTAGNEHNDQKADDKISRDHQSAPARHPAHQAGITCLKFGEFGFSGGQFSDSFLMPAQQPNRQNGHQRARQQIGRHHGKPNGQRERDEHGLGRAHHEQGRCEHRQDAEHGQQTRPDGLGGGIQRRAIERLAAGEMNVNILDADGGLVHQDADRQRQPAQGHDIDSLPGDPQRQHGAEERERNVDDDNESAAPIAQEHQNHQPGQQRAERPFQR